MNLLHLHYFYIVAKEGGFTRAAESLRIQQPAISRMVKQLEESLGFRLLERRKLGVQLTARGKQVFRSAERIFQEVEHLKGNLGQIKGECAGDLTFGASDPIASLLVPALLKPYLARYPKVYPQFASGTATSLLRSLQKGRLEFGLFFHLPNLPSGLVVTDRLPIRFHLVVKSDLKKKKEVLESFIGSREIDDQANQKFPTLQKWKLREKNAKIKISTNNLMAHKELVAKGLGISVLPAFLVGKELASGEFSDLLPRENLKFDLKVVFRETATPSTNAKEFKRDLVLFAEAAQQ